MLNSTHLNMINYIQKHSPNLENTVLPIMYDLYKAGELKLKPEDIVPVANFSYSLGDYDKVIKIAGRFNQKKPRPSRK